MLHDIPDGRKPFFREIRKLIIERLPQTDVLLDLAGILPRPKQKVIPHMFLALSKRKTPPLTEPATAKVHPVENHIYKKLHFHNRREAVSAYLGFNHVAASRV